MQAVTESKASSKEKVIWAPTKAAVALYPYQERWVRDQSRFKLAVKATQIGYSFAAALEAVLDCLEHRTLWIVLSRGERQSDEFMQKIKMHTKALRIAGSRFNHSFFDQAKMRQHEVTFPNGSRIIGLPANPDTARGYTGNMILDEFAFHQQDREIWAAAFGRISRGDLKLRVISTPNGQRGRYFELVKTLGFITPPKDLSNSARIAGVWSGHWCDIHSAVKEGCPMDTEALRQATGDEETWQQEFECVFLSARDQYIPLDLIVECEEPTTTVSLPNRWEKSSEEREYYFGYDVARVHDLAVLAVVEKIGDVLWTRALIELADTKFSSQERLLRDYIPFCRRGAIDATGLGKEFAERLAKDFPEKVESFHFTSSSKQALALRMKQHFEERAVRIPEHRALRRDLTAVKRIITSAGNIRFDAERTEEGHADRFWALALALHAAQEGVVAASDGWESEKAWYAGSGFGNRDSESGERGREELAWD